MKNLEKYIEYIDVDNKYYSKVKKAKPNFFVIKNIPSKWNIDKTNEFWTMLYRKDIKIPNQGFKIHISTEFNEAEQLLQVASKILFFNNIVFKYVSTKENLFNMYAKHGNRVQAGKFITAYPKEEQFVDILKKLEPELSHFKQGPYIFTDKQYKDTNIYYRYGAFNQIKNKNGEYCILDPNGELIVDERSSKFKLPSFIILPKELLEIDELEMSPKIQSPLSKYKIENAIRYSNAGGIYNAIRKSDSIPCVIKEARSQIGLDTTNTTSLERLDNEYKALEKLKNVDGVVKIYDYFKVWKHTFMVLEKVEGITLHSWISRNYPFSKTQSTEEYFEKVKKIINDIKKTIECMHNNGIAMCDLQTHNIFVDENLKITIIDFETAEVPDIKSSIKLGTKGFAHQLNELPKDRDWYSLNRIFHHLLMPSGSIYDFNYSINVLNCKWIYQNYNKDNFDFYISFQLDIEKNLTTFRKIFYNTYEEALLSLDEIIYNKDIDTTILLLTNGLLQDVNVNSPSLISGDIRQHELDCGIYNIQNGGFGAIFALNKVGKINSNTSHWIENSIKKIIQSTFNEGFLTGISGIASVLYEIGYKQEALEIIDKITFNERKNVTLRSGLAGIGLVFTMIYAHTSNDKYLKKARDIANIIRDILEEEYKAIGTDWDSVNVGLMDGLAGISLFYSILFWVTKHDEYKIKSKSLLLKELENKHYYTDGSLQLKDNHNRMLPYLSQGSIGLGIAIDVYKRVTMNNDFSLELEQIEKVKDSRISIDASLYDGILGFILLPTFSKITKIEDMIQLVHIYFIETDDKILIPGKMFYKLSSDLQTGVTGALLALLSAKENKSCNWLPLLESTLNNV
ncbi:MAG: class III lanthionine synthetase LanKC [Defluviitaleaceae bacterium]|nr:class III lanthionine synthetase LanKC [Defluviitaleaceae bacterium]